MRAGSVTVEASAAAALRLLRQGASAEQLERPGGGGPGTPWRGHAGISRSARACRQPVYVLRDLVGSAPELRSSCSLAAVRADATDTLLDGQTTRAVHKLACPARLLLAERGIVNEPQGLWGEDQLDAAGLDQGRVAVERVDDVDHHTILVGAKGAARVADHIRDLAADVDR